jgi:hypothetical protein
LAGSVVLLVDSAGVDTSIVDEHGVVLALAADSSSELPEAWNTLAVTSGILDTVGRAQVDWLAHSPWTHCEALSANTDDSVVVGVWSAVFSRNAEVSLSDEPIVANTDSSLGIAVGRTDDVGDAQSLRTPDESLDADALVESEDLVL